MIQKIISGGQTGADRAALDFAIKHGIPYGGWIPKGRKTEDGVLPGKYHLRELPTGRYAKRTERNVLDSDGTLILSHGPLTGGSRVTREFAERYGKPWIHINLRTTPWPQTARLVTDWISRNNIRIMNVAGPRASQDPEIYQAAMDALDAALTV